MAEIRINATGELKLYDSDDSNYVSFKSAGTVSSNVAWVLPSADGSNGQALTTDGSGTLSWATASSADPSSADGDSLGTASAEWSDLYLADGGIVYFGNDQDVRLTHNADKGLIIKHSATADDKPVILTLQTGETDMAANDVIGKIEFQAPDEGTGTDAILVSGAIQAVAEGDHSSSSNATRLEFMTGASEAATAKMSISSGGIVGVGAGVPGDLGVGLHVKSADSSASANAAADELVIEGSGNSGISILSGNSSAGRIYFSDSGDDDIGQIRYNHDDNSMNFKVNALADSLKIDSAGHITMPLQSAVIGQTATQSNVTGDETNYTVTFGGTEVKDQNADFASPTFTAPVDGIYLAVYSVSLGGIASNHTRALMYINTSNRTYYPLSANCANQKNTASMIYNVSAIMDMDANDTLTTSLRIDGGSAVIDVDDIGKCGIIKIA